MTCGVRIATKVILLWRRLQQLVELSPIIGLDLWNGLRTFLRFIMWGALQRLQRHKLQSWFWGEIFTSMRITPQGITSQGISIFTIFNEPIVATCLVTGGWIRWLRGCGEISDWIWNVGKCENLVGKRHNYIDIGCCNAFFHFDKHHVAIWRIGLYISLKLE